MTGQAQPRVSAIPIPDAYALPGKDAAEAGPAQDTARQTQFLLQDDLEMFGKLMNEQLQLMRASSHSRFRTQELAALVGLWSRAFGGLADGATLCSRGSYPSAITLVRTVAELVAAQEGLRAGEMDEFRTWLAGSLSPDEQHKALELGLGRYFAGEVLASDPLLRSVYRPASDIGRPNFGATLLQVGPESNNSRLALAFADASFHLGWAQIVLGWLLALAVRQIRLVLAAEGIFSVADEQREQCETLAEQALDLLSAGDRCRVETVEEGGDRRYLVSGFRRSAGASPKKFLL